MEREEAIDIIKKNWPGSSFTMLRVALETLIPELTESEDEKTRKYVIDYFKGNKEELSEGFKWNGITVEEVIAWLEKQGEQKANSKFFNSIQIGDQVTRNEDGVLVNLSQLKRVAKKDEKQGEQKPVEWSEEDKRCLMSAISACEQAADEYEHSQKYIDAIDWLQSIKDRIMSQPKVELTQLDKNILEAAIAFVEQNNHFNCWRGIDKRTVLSALHSLRPKSQWKPSEEQIEAVKRASNGSRAIASNDYLIMESLYNDLKKLKA